MRVLKYVPEFVIVAIVAAILLLAFRPLPARGAEPAFTVRAAAPKFDIRPAANAEPAKVVVVPGWWVLRPDGLWHFQVEPPAQVVPASRPFVAARGSGSRRTTAAGPVGTSPPRGPEPGSSWGGTLTVRIGTAVRSAGTRADTNCESGG